MKKVIFDSKYDYLKGILDEDIEINYGENVEEVKILKDILNNNNDEKDKKEMHLAFKLDGSEYAKSLIICECGYVKLSETELKEHELCPKCKAKLEKLSEEIYFEEDTDLGFSEIISVGEYIGKDRYDSDSDCAILKFNIEQYQLLLKMGSIKITSNNFITNTLKISDSIEFETSYEAYDGCYPEGLLERYYYTYFDDNSILKPNYDELLEEIYKHIPKFKVFLNDFNIDLSYKGCYYGYDEDVKRLDIERAIKALTCFVKFNEFTKPNKINQIFIKHLMEYKYCYDEGYGYKDDEEYKNITEDNLKEISKNIKELYSREDLFEKILSESKDLVGLTIISRKILKNTSMFIENIELIQRYNELIHSSNDLLNLKDFIIEIENNHLTDYILNYVKSERDLIEMYKLKESFKEVNLKDFIYYIIRGANNEHISIYNVIDRIERMVNAGVVPEIKGSFKNKYYKKVIVLKKYSDKKDELIEASQKNTFDAIYKLLMAN